MTTQQLASPWPTAGGFQRASLGTWHGDAALLLRGPGLPADLHFFVATGAATLRTVALLFLAGALGALYPMIRVARLPISSTLHEAVT